MADPVAWLLIEHGWNVIGADGSGLGRVHEVLGDADADIFDGLLVARGAAGAERYIPSERVTAIYEWRIEVDVDAAQLDSLERLAPGSVRARVR